MKWSVNGAALVLTLSLTGALAQTTKPDVSAAPSANNSGTGIAGSPGSKNGPAAKPDNTVGNNAQPNSTVQQQDTSKIKGLPGNKSGPATKQPDRQ
jgi:hypothetical protein